MSKCECFSKNLKMVKERVESKIPRDVSDLNVEWDNSSFFLGGDYSLVNPKINVSYRAKKKNGTPAKNLTRDSFSLVADFCCYCGRKLDKSDKEKRL